MKKKFTIYTLKTLLERTEDYGNCKEWTGYCQNKTPHAQHDGVFMPVRKLIWKLLGNEVKPKHFYGTSCGNHKCVNPDHIVERNHSEHMRMLSSHVNYKDTRRMAKLCFAAAKRRIFTDEQIQAIYLDGRSCRQIAVDYKCHSSTISKIKRGASNKAAIAKNNPFWQLMA